MQRTVLMYIIISLFIFSCETTDNKDPNSNQISLSPKTIQSALISASSKYFKVDADQLDVYSVSTNAQGYGVYKIYNKNRKGVSAVFVASKQGIIKPGSKNHTFSTAAKVCQLLKKLPHQAILAAKLYLLFSKQKRIYGMLIDSSDIYADAHNAPEIKAPKATADGSGFLLEFWTKNINTDYFYHLKIEINADGTASLDSEDKKQYK